MYASANLCVFMHWLYTTECNAAELRGTEQGMLKQQRSGSAGVCWSGEVERPNGASTIGLEVGNIGTCRVFGPARPS